MSHERKELERTKVKEVVNEYLSLSRKFENPPKVVLKLNTQSPNVALINAPSHGVGMELEHAILKPRLGLNETPILCLVHDDLKDKVSFMIKGVAPAEARDFHLETYIDLDSAKNCVKEFLIK